MFICMTNKFNSILQILFVCHLVGSMLGKVPKLELWLEKGIYNPFSKTGYLPSLQALLKTINVASNSALCPDHKYPAWYLEN